jgi:hypothetical protein
MTMTGRHVILWAPAVAIVAASVIALALWPSPGTGKSAAATTVSRASRPAVMAPPPAAQGRKGMDPGRSYAVPIPCGEDETALGYAGVVRPGDTAAAREELGAALLAQVGDAATGQVLDLARSPAGTVYFSRWLPVYPQSRQPRLLSCNYLLADKPADQPIMDAAIAATVRAGYFRSVRSVRSQLQIVLVSDDPAADGSVIVTIMVSGPLQSPGVPNGPKGGGHPPLYSLTSYTVLEQVAGAKVTGVARGGL